MEFTTFDKILSIKTGKLDANAMEDHGIYPFFTCSRQIYQINSYAFDCEAVLLAGNNASGDFNVKYYNGKFNAYQRTYVISKKSNYIDLKFVKYKLDNYLIDLKKMSVGANTKFLKLGMIKNIEIPIPPLQEQQAIVAKLDQAFAQIDQAKANIEKNIQNAKELFKSKLNQIFTQKGDGWENGKLSNYIKYDKSKNQKKIPYVGLENIESNTGKYLGKHEIGEVKSDTFYFTSEHILFGRLRPYLNKVLRPNFEGHCSTEIFPIIITGNNLLRDFLYYWLTSESTINKINETCTGARMPRANMNEVLNFNFAFPNSKDVQQQIIIQLDQLQEQTNQLVTKYEQKLANLEELKKSILEKAFKGELV